MIALINALRASLAGLFIVINTLFWGFIPLLVVALIKFFFRWAPITQWCNRNLERMAESWASVNNFLLRYLMPTRWEISGDLNLQHDQWYFVACNHQSWVDVLTLNYVLNRKIPFFRTFIKQALIWLPAIGLGCWAMDFPFMKRYDKKKLSKNPGLRNKDVNTTIKACQKFTHRPVSILSFMEGTRFTQKKHDKQQSPYKHLLKPKTGGLALVLNALGDRIRTLIDVTIIYPDHKKSFANFLLGKLPRVVVIVRQIEIPDTLQQGDYTTDPAFRQRIKEWVHGYWEEKDKQIEAFYEKEI